MTTQLYPITTVTGKGSRPKMHPRSQPPHGDECRCLPCWWGDPRIPPHLKDRLVDGWCFPDAHVPGCQGGCHNPTNDISNFVLVAYADGSNEPPLTADVIAAYDAELVHAGRTTTTMKTYRTVWTRFAGAFERLPTDRGLILDYLANYDDLSGKYRQKIQDTIHYLYKYAASLSWLSSDSMMGIKRPTAEEQMPNPMTLEQVGKVLNLDLSLRERAAFHLLAGHGWRQNELLEMTAKDVRSVRGGQIWCHGKQRNEWAAVLPETADLLNALADGLTDGDQVFRGERGRNERFGYEGMRKLVRGVIDRAGMSGFTGHNLRDTFASLVTEHSGDQTLAMALIRDKIPGVASRYVKRDLPTLLERHSPLRQLAGLPHQQKETPPPEQAGESENRSYDDDWWRRGRVELPVQKWP